MSKIVKTQIIETVTYTPSRVDILNRAWDRLCQGITRSLHLNEDADTSQYMAQATALVELLEVHDCGSTGGFDKGQQKS